MTKLVLCPVSLDTCPFYQQGKCYFANFISPGRHSYSCRHVNLTSQFICSFIFLTNYLNSTCVTCSVLQCNCEWACQHKDNKVVLWQIDNIGLTSRQYDQSKIYWSAEEDKWDESPETKNVKCYYGCLYHQDYLNIQHQVIENKRTTEIGSRPYNAPRKTIARARADFSKLLSITWMNSSGYQVIINIYIIWEQFI